MIHLLGFLKNPLFKLVADKTIGAISHKLEKDKIIKAKVIEAAKTVSVEQIKQQEHSLKDEWLTLVFSGIIICHFIPALQPAMSTGWDILTKANDYFWIIILTIVGGSFGMNLTNKMKKK